MNEIQTKQRIMRSSPKNDLVWSDEIPEVPSLDARDDDFLSVDYSTATQVSTNNGRVTERHETEMMLRKRLDVVRSSRPSKSMSTEEIIAKGSKAFIKAELEPIKYDERVPENHNAEKLTPVERVDDDEEEVEERSPQKEMKKKSRRRKVKKEKRRVKNDKKRGKNVDDIDNIDQFVFEENDIVVPVVEPELSGNWRTQLLETKNAKENKKSKVQFFYIDESDSLASASSFLVDDDFLSACQPMNCFANE